MKISVLRAVVTGSVGLLREAGDGYATPIVRKPDPSPWFFRCFKSDKPLFTIFEVLLRL